MTSTSHLHPEDRPEFERILDDALREHAARPLAPGSRVLSSEQLRAMALGAVEPIAACAAGEYATWTSARDTLREADRTGTGRGGDHGAGSGSSSGSGSGSASGSGSGSASGSGSGSASGSGSGSASGSGSGSGRESAGGRPLTLAGAVGEGLSESTGAGLLAVVSVLTPLLAGAAAVIFLLVGYALHLLTPEPALAAPMRSAGWVFAAVAAAGIVVAMAGLLLTALRNGGVSAAARPVTGRRPRRRGGAARARAAEAARESWREALRTRGVEPFLAEALAAGAGPEPEAREPRFEGRLARLGFDGPAFSQPGYSSPAEKGEGRDRDAARPGYSSPDYSSPDYGGPEHPPE